MNNNPPRFVSPLGPSLYQPQINRSFKQTVKEGFAVGLGASVARNIIDRIFSPSPSINPSNTSTPSITPSPVSESCFPEKQSFDTCIKENRDIKTCELSMKVYHNCLDSNNKQ